MDYETIRIIKVSQQDLPSATQATASRSQSVSFTSLAFGGGFCSKRTYSNAALPASQNSARSGAQADHPGAPDPRLRLCGGHVPPPSPVQFFLGRLTHPAY